ncbi:MAG: hypothetical protein K8T90_19385 [Planctomycetes bacterium]|nr:hypothetical protein [Planctomycetota bacterium]
MVRFLVALLVLAAVFVGIEISHPKGFMGMVAEFTGPRTPDPTRADADAASAPPKAAPEPMKTFWGPGATKELSWADRDYDRGDFDGAVANYSSSRLLAANQDERYRALKGMERSLLAWALVHGAPKVSGSSEALAAELTARITRSESELSERTWMETTRWAAGAGFRDRLHYLAEQTLDCARPGGFVQGALDAAVVTATGRREEIAAAMASRGLRPGAKLDALPLPGAGEASGIGSAAAKPADSDESGIGGVNDRGVPFGAFSADTRTKLKQAVKLERQGASAYAAAGPDSPNRVENRHTAMDCLKKARDIYVEAQGEDSTSRDLDERLKHVMQMLAQLKKDEGISGK